MTLRSLCSLAALLGVIFLGTPALDSGLVPAAGPARQRPPAQAVPAAAVPLEEEDSQLAECAQEEIGWNYSLWRKALLRRMTILSLSPRPAHWEAAGLLRRIVEWEEENHVELVINGSLVQDLRQQALVARAAQASRLLGQLRERLKEKLFRVSSVPGDKGHEWVVGNAHQLLATLEDLESRQRALATRLRKSEERRMERRKRLMKKLEQELFKDLDLESGGNGANRP